MTEDPDMVRSEIVQAAVRGWETHLGRCSRTEQALTRAVVVSHLLLGAPAGPPDAEGLDEALELLIAVRPGLFATWENSRGMVVPQIAPAEIVVDALWRYLLQALGTHDPQNLRVARVLVDRVMRIAITEPAGAVKVPVALLIHATYQAESWYLEIAAQDVERAIEVLGVLRPQFPGIVPTVLAVCREARQQVLDLQPEQARLKRWQRGQETRASKLAERADELSVRGAHEQAREKVDLALKIQKQIADALPGTPAALELDAWVHRTRARVLLRSGQASAALRDAERSLGGYQRLTTFDPEEFASTLDLAHQLWVETMSAAAASPPP